MREGLKVVRVRTHVLLVLFFACGLAFGAVRPRVLPASSRVYPIVTGDTSLPEVALMFNVDWGGEHIPAILKTLQEAKVNATFFVTGGWAKKNPGLVRGMAEAGHEIGNHGYFHGHPSEMGAGQIEDLIMKNEALLREILGTDPPRLFAPPYGEYSETSLMVAESLGYKTVLWTVDTVDWKKPPPESILERVSKATNGSLILMHPTEPTRLALAQAVRDLKERGMTPVTVSEILEETP